MRLVGVLLLLACMSLAQIRDSGADSLKSGVIASSGGAVALSALKDYTATGSITYFEREKQQTGAVTIRYHAGQLLRVDSSTDAGSRTWVLRGVTGESKQDDKKPSKLSPEVVRSLQNYSLPVNVISQSSTDDVSASQDTLRLTPSKRKALAGTPTEYKIDSSSNRILRVSTEVRVRPGVAPILQEFVYSDFRVVDGVLFPFLIEEWDAGVLMSRVQLEKISVNAGITAIDFELE